MLASISDHASAGAWMPRWLRAATGTWERRLFLAALLVRVIPAFLIYGTDDVAGWEAFGGAIVEGANPYLTKFAIVWPPLWLPFTALARYVADVTPLPFSFVIKLFPIAADLVLTFVLYAYASRFGVSARRTALLYALNPISIYTSAIHGQFDPLPALCLTMAVLAGEASADKTRGGRVGGWLGIGAAFKTWPLLILPAFVAQAGPLRNKVRTVVVSLTIFFVALAIPSLFLGFHHMTDALGYRSATAWWGLSSLADLGGWTVRAATFQWTFNIAMAVAALLLLPLRPPLARGALFLLLTFYVATPGFGLQYLVWVVPLALLADQRRALGYTILASLIIAIESLMRPWAGHIGDLFRLLPHIGYARAYGTGRDHRWTEIDRIPLWLYCVYWWLATGVSLVRARLAETAAPRQ